MTKTLYLIYIPGLGDRRIGGQSKAVSTWRLWGVKAEILQINWADSEPWQSKLQRLLTRIDELLAEGHEVGLVGASAGASAVINAYAARSDKIVGVVLIAGKVNRPESVGQSYKSKNPAFWESVQASAASLKKLSPTERSRIQSRYALADETVHKPDSHVAGADNRVVPSVTHVLTIASQLLVGAPMFIRFLKHLTAK